jgi:hypothetical protein
LLLDVAYRARFLFEYMQRLAGPFLLVLPLALPVVISAGAMVAVEAPTIASTTTL